MFDKFKHLSKLIGFIFLFNFLVFNFGIEPREASAATPVLDISATRVINYDIKFDGMYTIFDFAPYLAADEKIETFVLKKNNANVDVEQVNGEKKAWKSKLFLIDNDDVIINATAVIGGQQKKLGYQFSYRDHDAKYRPDFKFNKEDKFEVTFKKEWLDLYDEKDYVNVNVDNIGINENIWIKDIKNNNNKKVWDNITRNNFWDNSGYTFRATIRSKEHRWKLFTSTFDGKRDLGLMEIKIKSGKFTKVDKKDVNEIELLIEEPNQTAKGDKFRRIGESDLPDEKFDTSKRIVKYPNTIGMNNDFTMRLDRNSVNKKYEGFLSVSVLRYFNKLDFKASTADINAKDLKIDLRPMTKFLSTPSTKNKLIIFELNDNFTKGSVFLEKVGLATGETTINIGNKNFNKNKTYLAELTNGTTTVSTSFVYVPMAVSSTSVTQTSATINWVQPPSYTPVQDDSVEIYLKERSESTFSNIPKVTLIHDTRANAGAGRVDFTKVKSAQLTEITPGRRYDYKVVLKNQRGAIVSEGEFTTGSFLLKKPIEIKDAVYENNEFKVANTRTRNITVEWDIDAKNTNFSNADKVEIWIKPNGTSNFSGYPKDSKFQNPVFTANNNLQNLRKADITLPDWFERYHVDLIYTIGGKQVINPTDNNYGEASFNRRTAMAKVNLINMNVSDVTKTTAKVTWDYDHNFNGIKKYEPENGHKVELHVKKIPNGSDLTNNFEDSDLRFTAVHGNDNTNLLEQKQFNLTGLDVGQTYRARVRHTLSNGKFLTNFFNFATTEFSIQNLKAKQDSQSRKIKLTWGTSSDPEFGEGANDSDNIKVYIKESGQANYPETPLEGVTIQNYQEETQKREGESTGETQGPTPTKQTEIKLPKYNTSYDVKVEYSIKGKKIEEHVLAKADGELSLNVKEIGEELSKDGNKTWKAKIEWTYPTGFEKVDGENKDKVKLTVKKKEEAATRDTDSSSLPNGEEMDADSSTKSKDLTGLKANGEYEVTLVFVNDNAEVYTTSTTFKATNDLQIVGLKAGNVKSKTATISWDYTPDSKTFTKDTSKVEIYIKENEKKKSGTTSDDLKNYTKIYTAKHKGDDASARDGEVLTAQTESQHSQHKETQTNLKKFKSLNLTGLNVGKEYSIKVKYSGVNDGEGSSLYDAQAAEVSETKKEAEAEVTFKTVVEKFDATVFVSNQTSANYGWKYPEGYEIKDGDKIEIFVKEDSEKNRDSGVTTDYGNEPLLTLEHGSGDGKYNLNEVTRVDVSGLTPEKKYKSRIDFTMGTGENAYKISTEVSISTKAFNIKSFEVDSYQEYDILVKWAIEPDNVKFNPADKLQIFVKRASDTAYPTNPSYSLTGEEDTEGRSISNTFSDYVLAEAIGEEQNMKLVYTVGDKTYEKELTFTNTIDPIKASVSRVDETRALIEVTPPTNYEFVNGDKLLIYAKDEFAEGEVENDDSLVFEGVQSDDLNIADGMNFIELSYLLPEAKYDVLVKLDLEDGKAEPAKLEFTTKSLPLTDIKVESIDYNGGTISWDYGENPIDFFEGEDVNDTDILIVGMKESDGTPIGDTFDAVKAISIQEHLGQNISNVKDAKIEVPDKSKDYDVAICCDIGGLSYIKKTKLSFLSVSTSDDLITGDSAGINWKYPSNITFEENDKTEVFVKAKDDASYPETPQGSFTGQGNTSQTLNGLEESTEYVAKVQVTKEGLKIDPVEITFTTKANVPSDVVIEDIEYEIKGTSATFEIPNADTLDIETSGEIELRMGDEAYQGFKARFSEDGTSLIIEPTIPKKKYENIEVEVPLQNGEKFKMVIREFVTEPADLAQDWLSNAYSFAFERFPDEEGYGYWYNRMGDKKLNGEYFLKNLMFAEDEFTNRNLSDKDLIAALYQIVVNREFDQGGLDFWISIYNENLQNAQGNKKLAQEVLVDRMVHEPEFGKLCDNVGIFWRQSDQDQAGVVA